MFLHVPDDFMLKEIERSIHHFICVMKRILESGYVVLRGDCVKIALVLNLENFTKTLGTKE